MLTTDHNRHIFCPGHGHILASCLPGLAEKKVEREMARRNRDRKRMENIAQFVIVASTFIYFSSIAWVQEESVHIEGNLTDK